MNSISTIANLAKNRKGIISKLNHCFFKEEDLNKIAQPQHISEIDCTSHLVMKEVSTRVMALSAAEIQMITNNEPMETIFHVTG